MLPFPHFLEDANVYKDETEQTITIVTELYLYGSIATQDLADRIANNIARLWNGPEVILQLDEVEYAIHFQVAGFYTDSPRPLLRANQDFKKFFIRLEAQTDNPLGGISYMDGLHCNTGFFRLDNVAYEGATTEAHEIGHGWGLVPGTPDGHPINLNLIGKGQPGIMYPRGTLVDRQYQWNPTVGPGEYGGTLKPDKRVVTVDDVAMLGLDALPYDPQGRGFLGGLTNILH
jgi:hypothetical protein